MKRIKIISILFACVFLFSACGSKNATNTSITDKSTVQTENQNIRDKKDTSQTSDNTPPKDWEPTPIEDFDYKYDVELKGAVVSYKGTAEQVIFPSEINGDPVVAIGATKGPVSIVSGKQKGPSPIREVYIPEGVKVIGDGAFNNCIYLESINIPDSVTEIGFMAFSGCVRLASIRLPEGLQVIDGGAFELCEQLVTVECDSLNNLKYLDSDAFWETYWFNRQPDGFVFLGSNLLKFKGKAPSTLVIPDGTRLIASQAFYGSETTDASKVIKTAIIPEGVKYITRAFMGLHELVSVELPESITEIGEDAFYHCWSLTTINLPSGLTYIGEDAFSGCESLDEATKERILQINTNNTPLSR